MAVLALEDLWLRHELLHPWPFMLWTVASFERMGRANASCPAVLQGLEPEVRTYNTAIIACNMCGQPLEALRVRVPDAVQACWWPSSIFSAWAPDLLLCLHSWPIASAGAPGPPRLCGLRHR